MALAYTASAWYTWTHLFEGWVAQDDGALAMGALHVFQGQLPHRDFADNYTGGLSLLLGLCFRMGGVNLDVLRLCVFVFFLLWLAAILYVARRMAPAPAAGAVGVLAAVWSLVQYPAAMPSWFNLFFAGMGSAAVMRYLEVRHRRWLAAAGILGGLSILIKVIGFYYVAAVLLFLIFHEQQEAAQEARSVRRIPSFYSCFLAIGLAAFVGAILRLMWSRLDAMHLIDYIIPAAFLAAVILRQEWPLRDAAPAPRLQRFFGLAAPFLAGVALPIAIFLVPYARAHALRLLFHNVFGSLPSRLGSYTRLDPVDPIYMFGSLAIVLLLALGLFSSWPRSRFGKLMVLLALAAGLGWVSQTPGRWDWSDALWGSAVMLTPLLGWAGCALLMTNPSWADALTTQRRAQLFLLLALAVLCSFVQFPFPPPIYFCYTAPCTVLAAFALCTIRRRVAHPLILGSVLVFFAGYAITCMQPAHIYAHWNPVRKTAVEPINLPRCGHLRVEFPARYQAAIPLIQQAAKGNPIVATPECPEIFFLSGIPNASPQDTGLDPSELPPFLKSDSLRVIVFNLISPHAESTFSPETVQLLRKRFPNYRQFERYVVCWR